MNFQIRPRQSPATTHRYIRLLEATHLVTRVPALGKSRKKRIAKAPKIFMLDPALSLCLSGIHDSETLKTCRELGAHFETMIYLPFRAWGLAGGLLGHGTEARDIFYLALDHPTLSGLPISEHLRNFRRLFMHDRDRKVFLFLDGHLHAVKRSMRKKKYLPIDPFWELTYIASEEHKGGTMQNTVNVNDNFQEIGTKTIDERNRITLGEAFRGLKRVRLLKNKRGEILLQPVVEIPASELWLYRNEEALASVQRGLKDASAGKITKLTLDDLEQ